MPSRVGEAIEEARQAQDLGSECFCSQIHVDEHVHRETVRNAAMSLSGFYRLSETEYPNLAALHASEPSVIPLP